MQKAKKFGIKVEKRKIDPKKFVTETMRRQEAMAIRRDSKRAYLLKLWEQTERTEHMPNGTPFKVTNNQLVREAGGTFAGELNKPIIIVSDLLSAAERQAVARHELTEFEGDRGKKLTDFEQAIGKQTPAHDRAVKRENPLVGNEIGLTEMWAEKVCAVIGAPEFQHYTRKDYLEWRDSPEAVKKFGPRKK